MAHRAPAPAAGMGHEVRRHAQGNNGARAARARGHGRLALRERLRGADPSGGGVLVRSRPGLRRSCRGCREGRAMICRATTFDLTAILEIASASFTGDDALSENDFHALLSEPGTDVWVAVAQQGVRGFMVVQQHVEMELTVRLLAVAPEYRR